MCSYFILSWSVVLLKLCEKNKYKRKTNKQSTTFFLLILRLNRRRNCLKVNIKKLKTGILYFIFISRTKKGSRDIYLLQRPFWRSYRCREYLKRNNFHLHNILFQFPLLCIMMEYWIRFYGDFWLKFHFSIQTE